MNTGSEEFSRFSSGASIVLSAFLGFLIGLPLSLSYPSPTLQWLPIIFALIGAFNGWRWRKSRMYFYFCLLAVLLLSLILTFSVGAPELQPQ